MKPRLTIGMLRSFGQGAGTFASIPLNIMLGSGKSVPSLPSSAAWEQERDDILERANWLCRKIIVSPEQLLDAAPAAIGKGFQGEWAIYCCSMLAHALANIAALYPDKKTRCPQLIDKIVNIVNTPEIRRYDTVQWREDAMETLDGNNHHMTYLSILAWIITNYKFCGGDNRHNSLLNTLCATLVRRMHESSFDLNLLSYPHMQIWLPDMLVAIVALKNYARLNNGVYADTVEAWLRNAREKWIHRRTGLLAGMLPGESRFTKGAVVRGSHSALNCSYLTMVDEAFAREQYERLCAVLRAKASFMGKTMHGVKEYLRKSPKLAMAPGDAGIIVKGISAGGTAFALGAATFFEDWEFRHQMLRTAELAGHTVKQKRMRHYKISKLFLVGEATALAMRTNIKR